MHIFSALKVPTENKITTVYFGISKVGTSNIIAPDVIVNALDL
jgi:hypothetical protein